MTPAPERAGEARGGLREQYRDGRNLNARIALHRRFSTNRYGWARFVFEQLDLPERAQVLELGCGTGALWRANAAKTPPGWWMVLSDFSLGMLGEARGGLATLLKHAAMAQADAQALPFKAACFDAVIANHMLYHVRNRARAIFEIHRVLKPGGLACLSTNGRAHMRELHEMVERFLPGRGIANYVGTFGLESGLDQVRGQFADVKLRRYEDALAVTESQPLIDYVASVDRGLTADGLGALKSFLDAELGARGAIHITKDAGLFLARRR